MKLVRNTTNDGTCKYAAVRLDKLRADPANWLPSPVLAALKTLEDAGLLEYGAPGSEEEFFLIKLKDRNSTAALAAYANSVQPRDREFAEDVLELARRSGPRDNLTCQGSPWCKDPD